LEKKIESRWKMTYKKENYWLVTFLQS
jgi:hypothetical protein